MANHAVVNLGQVGTDYAAGNYNISWSAGVTDGTQDAQAYGLAQIPLTTLTSSLADNALRATISSQIASQTGISVTAGNLYFPMVNGAIANLI